MNLFIISLLIIIYTSISIQHDYVQKINGSDYINPTSNFFGYPYPSGRGSFLSALYPPKSKNSKGPPLISDKLYIYGGDDSSGYLYNY